MCRSGRPPSLAQFQGGKELGMLGRQLQLKNIVQIIQNSNTDSANFQAAYIFPIYRSLRFKLVN